MARLDEFLPTEFDQIYNDLKCSAVEGMYAVTAPRAVILGGQPGSGKSSLIRQLRLKKNNNSIVISGDDFRKEHPHFDKLYAQYGDDYVNHTQKFSSQVTERLIDELSREKYNLIIEGTLRTSTVPIRTAELLKSRGYHVELAVMAVPPILSYIGTIERYEKMKEIGTTPRMTTKQQHDSTVNAIIDSIENVYQSGVFDDIALYNRSSDCLYKMTDTPEIHPGAVLQREHDRNISMQESNYLDNVVEYIEKSLKSHTDTTDDLLDEMHIQVARAELRADLCENGLHLTDGILEALDELVRSTGKIWKLEDIAQAYKTDENANQYINDIGFRLENQQLEMVEVQAEI